MVLFKGKTYDVLKFLALIALPALATAYFALSGIWGLPAADKVVGTIVVIDTFLGAILQMSSTAYSKSDERFDGAINVIEEHTGKKVVTLDLEDNPHAIEEKTEILFKVNKKGEVT